MQDKTKADNTHIVYTPQQQSKEVSIKYTDQASKFSVLNQGNRYITVMYAKDRNLILVEPKYMDAWGYSYGNEIRRLAQGMPWRVNGTNMIFFISKAKAPMN